MTWREPPRVATAVAPRAETATRVSAPATPAQMSSDAWCARSMATHASMPCAAMMPSTWSRTSACVWPDASHDVRVMAADAKARSCGRAWAAIARATNSSVSLSSICGRGKGVAVVAAPGLRTSHAHSHVPAPRCRSSRD